MRATACCRQCLSRVNLSEALIRSSARNSLPSIRSQPLRTTSFARTTTPLSATSRRNLFSLFKKKEDIPKPLIEQHDLFHPFEDSPSPRIRDRAEHIKRHAYCPHPEHQQTATPAHVNHTCPDCGIPVYCSEEHWAEDYEEHLKVCDALKEANEDDHDLVSGRHFPEFIYPTEQLDDALVNMTNWDTFMYSRQSKAIDDMRALRQTTRLLTYPTTIASFLHELSPYTTRNRLTSEGLRSLMALRYTLHPPARGEGADMKGLRQSSPPVRLFILGARAESCLPREVWHQLSYLFPRSRFHLVFIGPEAMAGRPQDPLPEKTPSNPYGAIIEKVSNHMKISTFVEYYHTLHEANYFYPYDPYFDCFVMFHPGLGHAITSKEWERSLPQLLSTKCPILVTGYTQEDMDRDVRFVEEKCKGEYDILLQPGDNRFKSLRKDIDDNNPSEVSQGNYGVWAFRGKRYETTMHNKAE